MTDIADIGIKLDARQVDAGIKSLDRLNATGMHTASMANGIVEAFKTMAETIGSAFAVERIIEFSVEMTKAAARFNELGMALDVLGKNTGTTKWYINELTESIRQMGVDDDVARELLAKMLETNMDVARSIDIVRVAQNAMVISGGDMKDTIDTITIALESGMSRTLKHMGLNVDFAKSEAELARSLGVTTLQLTDQEKMHARMNELMRAGVNITGAYAEAVNNPIIAMQRAKIAFEDASKAIAQSFQPAYLAAAKALDDIAQAMAGHVDQIANAIQALGVAASAFVGIKLAEYFLTMSINLKSMVSVIWTLMGGWATVAAAAVGALYYFRDSEVTLMGTTAELRDFMRATWELIRDTVTSAIDYITITFPGISDEWKLVMEDVLETTIGYLDKVIGVFVGTGRSIGAVLADIKSGSFGSIFADIKSEFANALDKNYITDLADEIARRAEELRNLRKEMQSEEDQRTRQLEYELDLQTQIAAEEKGRAAIVRPPDQGQIDAAAKKTLDILKEQAVLESQMALLRKGEDPQQHARLASLKQELIYDKDLSKASQQQKDLWIQQATAIDALVERVRIMADAYKMRLDTAGLKAEDDMLAKDAKSTLYLAEAKAKLALATINADAATQQYVIDSAKAADLEQKRHDVIVAAQDLADTTAQIKAGMIIDDQQRAEAELDIEKDKWLRIIAQAKSGSDEQKKIQASYDAWLQASQANITGKPWRDAIGQMEQTFHDGFVKMLEDGKSNWSSAWKSMKNSFKTTVIDYIYMAFAKPFVIQVVASLVGLTGISTSGTALAGVNSITGAAGTAGNALGALSNISSLADVGKVIAGGFSSAIESLGPFGLGAIGGALIGNLTGGSQTGGAIGGALGGFGSVLLASGSSAIGAELGSIFGSAVPIIGTIVGGLIGSFVGSLFGGQPSNYTAVSHANLNTGVVTQLPGDSPNATTIKGANSLATIATQISSTLKAVTGGSMALSNIYTEVGQRDRIAIGLIDDAGKLIKTSSDTYRAYAPSNTKGAVEGLAEILTTNLTGVTETLKSQLIAVEKKIDFSNGEQAAADLQFAFQLLSGSLFKTTDTTSQMKKTIDALNKSYEDSKAQATRLGLSTDEVTKAYNAARAALTSGFNESIQQSILAITDPLAAELEAFAKTAADRLQEAKDGGANLVAVEQLTALERDQIIQKYAQQSTNALAGQAKSILDFVHQLTGTTSSPLATQEALTNAKAYYESTLTSAQGGNSEAQAAITQAAKDYLDLKREFSASSAEYFSTFNSVTASLTMLANAMNVNAGTTTAVGYTTAQQDALDKIAETISGGPSPAPAPAPGTSPATSPSISISQQQRAQEAADKAEIRAAQTIELLTAIGQELVRQTADGKITAAQLEQLQRVIDKQQSSLDRLAQKPVKRSA